MFIVDRIEEGFVVLEAEDKTMRDVELKEFPKGVKAGDVIVSEDGRYVIDEEATRKRTEEIRTMMERLFED